MALFNVKIISQALLLGAFLRKVVENYTVENVKLIAKLFYDPDLTVHEVKTRLNLEDFEIHECLYIAQVFFKKAGNDFTLGDRKPDIDVVYSLDQLTKLFDQGLSDAVIAPLVNRGYRSVQVYREKYEFLKGNALPLKKMVQSEKGILFVAQQFYKTGLPIKSIAELMGRTMLEITQLLEKDTIETDQLFSGQEQWKVRNKWRVKSKRTKKQNLNDAEPRPMPKNLKPSKQFGALQNLFNRYIRTRDQHKPCISCGATDEVFGLECGHYLTIGSRPELRFHEDNAHGQCARCNRNLSGNQQAYRQNLIDRIGLERVEKLEGPFYRKKRLKDSLEDIELMRAYYHNKIRELTNE